MMAKFMVLYNSNQTSSQRMAQSTPEEMKAGMAAWMDWKDKLDAGLKFDWGLPLEVVEHLTATGTSASDSHVSGYSTMEAESKDEVISALKSHPHLQQPDTSIDVLEMLAMPGM